MKLKHAALAWIVLASTVSAQQPAKPSAPPADPMAWAYRNTFEITIPTVGYKARRYIEPDGTWRSVSNYGGVETGTWELKDGNSCFTQTDPVPEEGYRRLCAPAPPRVVGDVWFGSDAVSGNMLRMEVVAGRD